MTHPNDALRLVQAIRDWLREPDNAESFSFNDLVEWLNRRPIGLVTAALESLAAAPASPLPGGGTSYAAGGLDVLSRIRSRLNEQIDRAEADLNSTVTIRLNDAKAIRHMLAPAAPTGEPK